MAFSSSCLPISPYVSLIHIRNSSTAFGSIWITLRHLHAMIQSFACLWHSCLQLIDLMGSLWNNIQWDPSWVFCRIELMIQACHIMPWVQLHSTASLYFVTTKLRIFTIHLHQDINRWTSNLHDGSVIIQVMFIQISLYKCFRNVTFCNISNL